MHENGVVPSTIHQCLKYYRGTKKKIIGDVRPFTEAESHFADTKFFKEAGMTSEMMPSTIPSTGKRPYKKSQSRLNTKISQKMEQGRK